MSNRRIAFLLVGVLLLGANLAPAGEPHGYAVLSAEWVEDPGETLGTNERLVRVVVRAAVVVNSARLGFRSPDDVSLTPHVGGAGAGPLAAPAGPDGTPRLILGDLRKGESKSVEFLVHAPPSKSGVAAFILSGELASGRSFEEKVGWTVGTPVGALLRHGAAEFPAKIVPEENP